MESKKIYARADYPYGTIVIQNAKLPKTKYLQGRINGFLEGVVSLYFKGIFEKNILNAIFHTCERETDEALGKKHLDVKGAVQALADANVGIAYLSEYHYKSTADMLERSYTDQFDEGYKAGTEDAEMAKDLYECMNAEHEAEWGRAKLDEKQSFASFGEKWNFSAENWMH